MQVSRGGLEVAMAQQELDGAAVDACFQQMGGEAMAVRIRILPMKGPQSPFIIVTIRFMENMARSFAGYGATRAIKS
jgi:hypothetical protein